MSAGHAPRSLLSSSGYTFVELLVVATIVMILASAIMPLAKVTSTRTREAELRRSLREIRDAIDAYKRASDDGRIVRSPVQSGYPPTLSVLAEGVTDAKSPSGARIYFLRRVPRDPLRPDPSVPPEDTWGLRSYDSAPQEPKPGSDVFDVYSLNERKGLNGVRYRLW